MWGVGALIQGITGRDLHQLTGVEEGKEWTEKEEKNGGWNDTSFF